MAAASLTTIRAGGTLERGARTTAPSIASKVQLSLEMAVFFVAAPIGLTYAVHDLRLPLFIVLQPVLAALIVFLLLDPTFRVRRELARGVSWREVARIIILFALVGTAITMATASLFPSLFLSFPRLRPQMWLTIILLYPLLSVVAQELVYRTFFFHRYGPLFGQSTWAAILVNGALFGFAHIVFHNWIAVLGTAVTGTLFAWRYYRTQSFWAVWFEHTLYGALVFTVGLGKFFFTGVAL